MIHIKELMNICSENGITYTRQSLYNIGLKEGFIQYSNDNLHGRYILNVEKFHEWVEAINTTLIPEGFVTLEKAGEVFGCSKTYLYRIIVKYGCTDGVMVIKHKYYVKPLLINKYLGKKYRKENM